MKKPSTLPRSLQMRLDIAKKQVEKMPSEQLEEYLARHGRNRTRSIATWGLDNIGSRVDGLEFVPSNVSQLADVLDEVQEHNEHPTDYLSSAVLKAATSVQQSSHGSHARGADQRYSEIWSWLVDHGYEKAKIGHRGLLEERAAEYFKSSRKTITRAINAQRDKSLGQ